MDIERFNTRGDLDQEGILVLYVDHQQMKENYRVQLEAAHRWILELESRMEKYHPITSKHEHFQMLTEAEIEKL